MKLLLSLWLGLTLLLVTTGKSKAEEPKRVPGKKIIDLHCHVAGIGAGDSGCYVSPRLRQSWKYRVYLHAFGLTEKEVRQSGDAIILERLSRELAQSELVGGAVVLALDGVVGENGELDLSKTEIYIPNEFVEREVKKYPNLYFGASVNPYRQDALARLEMVAAAGAVLVKWLPTIQNIDPADPQLLPFYLKLKELHLPLLVHTGDEHSFTKARQELGAPSHLRFPLSLGVTVIAAHAASTGKDDGVDNMEVLLKMLGVYPNLHADISSLTQINKKSYLARLLKHKEIHGKLLYGTDMPLLKTPLVSPAWFVFDLAPWKIWALSEIANPWDQDVRLKQELGVPDLVFLQANQVLNFQR